MENKIVIRFKAVGNAPVMKQQKFRISSTQKVSFLLDFLKKQLKVTDASLFIFINSTFAPSPDELISNLFQCFGSDGVLVVNYCTTMAWG